jgi:hypothetical protein
LRGKEIVIMNRRPLLWYRGVRQAIEIAAYIGAAAFFSYLVLLPR